MGIYEYQRASMKQGSWHGPQVLGRSRTTRVRETADVVIAGRVVYIQSPPRLTQRQSPAGATRIPTGKSSEVEQPTQPGEEEAAHPLPMSIEPLSWLCLAHRPGNEPDVHKHAAPQGRLHRHSLCCTARNHPSAAICTLAYIFPLQTLSIIYVGIAAAAIQHGGGRHVTTLEPAEVIMDIYYTIISFVLGVMPFIIPKSAVAILLNKILNPGTVRVMIMWVCVGHLLPAGRRHAHHQLCPMYPSCGTMGWRRGHMLGPCDCCRLCPRSWCRVGRL
ncbi:hypothetical protein B0H67DRAFT_578123 [Lasiosphaeris hirsuta]|uniref:Uncharacterized protein n=1 Tax=Lasiosphaeris hirsuta TaxID=260670 RepID=A0AA40ASD6_9PEZI|nr:hypothetical protein B0H67DRAFT_578123 [Lasiosphaeris hirsuta]